MSEKKENEEVAETKTEPEVKKEESAEKAPEEKKEKKKAPPKKKTVNWPLRDVKEPHENDVLYGRGGGTNHHPGNKRYRKMVEERKLDYVNSKRLDKPLVALEIIREWRGQDPPGRFLKLDEKTGLWQDVGDKKAREKTSQALREKAPLIRKQQEEGGSKSEEEGENAGEEVTKNTRFAEGTKSGDSNNSGINRAVLARDHSLGREYVAEPVTLEGFSWEEPVVQLNGERVRSGGSMGPPRHGYPSRTSSSSSMGGPPPPGYPNGRTGSASSMGVPPYPPRAGSQGGPPSGDYSGYDSQRQFSGTRYESWGSLGSSTIPPAMPYSQYPYERSGGSMGYDYTPPYTAIQREHSLSGNALRGASLSQPVPTDCFAWGDAPPMPPGPHSRGGQAPPWPSQAPPPRYPSGDGRSSFNRTPSGRSTGEIPIEPASTGQEYAKPPSPYNVDERRERPIEPAPTGQEYAKPSSPYNVDPAIAKTWSSQSEDYEKAANVIGESITGSPERLQQTASPSSRSLMRRKHSSSKNGDCQQKKSDSNIPRPNIVKRHTSNQNENIETRKDLRGTSVKRAALNRDNSLASNRLKAAYPPDKIGRDIFETEMRSLSTSMELSTLDSRAKSVRPKPLSSEERTSTFDKIAMDLFTRPEPLKASSRSSTIDALSLDFGDDPLLSSDAYLRDRLRTSSTDAFLSDQEPAKPAPLTPEGRLSTMDKFFDEIAVGPIGEDRRPSLSAPLDLSRGASVSEWLNNG